MEDTFSGFWIAVPFLWLGFWIAVSVFYRRLHDLPIIPRLPKDALFKERRGSGRSRKNVITSIGGASNCLLVAVTDTELIVAPFFPFNLMFLGQIYGLEFRAPRSSIRSAEKKQGRFSTTILITFEGDYPAPFELRLRKADAFLHALKDRGSHRQNARI